MTTLRLIVDEIVDPRAGRRAIVAEELARALIEAAPRGADVAGVVSASPEADYAYLAERLPGLRQLHKSALARRELMAAWQHGVTPLPGSGMLHSPSLLAPLFRHDRVNDPSTQTVVTIDDALAWTRPDLVPPRRASWMRAMGKRAARYADAVVVPTHTTADALADHLALDDRIRVIGEAAASSATTPTDAATRRARLGVTDRYVVAEIDRDARDGYPELVEASRDPLFGARLVLLASSASTDLSALPDDRPDVLVALHPEDRASIIAGASAFVQPTRTTGFGGAMIDALALGRPIVHLTAGGTAEVVADAGVALERDGDGFPGRLADAIGGILADDARADRLGVAANDRSRAFSWRDAAEKTWQLHADL